jgi:hypothetical protein
MRLVVDQPSAVYQDLKIGSLLCDFIFLSGGVHGSF